MPDLPVGEPVPGWRPLPRPRRVVLEGTTVRAEPLDPAAHAAGLFGASHAPPDDPQQWDYLPYGPFAGEHAFAAWLGTVTGLEDPFFYALVQSPAGRPLGMASFVRIEPEHGSIEIGHIWIGGAHQRTRPATEAIYVLMRHALGDLGYRRLEWRCDALNRRSRRAAQRLGFTFEGVFRHHMVVKGRSRDTAWFSVIDTEWPAVRAGLERWLGDDNFDSRGVQRESLAAARERSGARAAG